MTANKHHIVHNRQEWDLRPAGEYLRRQPSLIHSIEDEGHKELHRECPSIPLIGHYALMKVANLYVPGSNILQSIDNLSFAIEDAHDTPRTFDLDKRVGMLAVEALQMQKVFIREYGRREAA